MNSRQQGFTLIELMISLVLGLIISAAVMQVYIMSIRTNTIQASSSNLQNTSVFGFQSLEHNIRLANLGNDITSIKSDTGFGGIVLTRNNLPIEGDFLTRSGDGVTNTNVGSDQLTISYRNISGRVMSDCEGNDVPDGVLVVERYFMSGTAPNLHLHCDSGHFTGNNLGDLANGTARLGAGDVEFISNVDQFRILLGMQTEGNNPQITFLSPQAYVNLGADTQEPIVAVRLGIVSRGGTAILGEEGATQFQIFGETNTLIGNAANNAQVRGVYESNVLLRNARVVHTTGRD